MTRAFGLCDNCSTNCRDSNPGHRSACVHCSATNKLSGRFREAGGSVELDTCSDLLIVVATYNELENLPKLLDELMVLLPQATILVVDDNSPDGTPAWLAEQSDVRPQLRFLIREKKVGLGAAAAAGFAWDAAWPVWLVTMDADFSHRPEDVCRVLARAVADDTIDLVIGSRYVAGGEIVGWPWRRRVASRWINRLTRWSLGLTTRDNSGALRGLPDGRLAEYPGGSVGVDRVCLFAGSAVAVCDGTTPGWLRFRSALLIACEASPKSVSAKRLLRSRGCCGGAGLARGTDEDGLGQSAACWRGAGSSEALLVKLSRTATASAWRVNLGTAGRAAGNSLGWVVEMPKKTGLRTGAESAQRSGGVHPVRLGVLCVGLLLAASLLTWVQLAPGKT